MEPASPTPSGFTADTFSRPATFSAGRELCCLAESSSTRYESKFVFFNPEFELLDDENAGRPASLDIGRIVPVYEETRGTDQPPVSPHYCQRSRRSCRPMSMIPFPERFAKRTWFSGSSNMSRAHSFSRSAGDSVEALNRRDVSISSPSDFRRVLSARTHLRATAQEERMLAREFDLKTTNAIRQQRQKDLAVSPDRSAEARAEGDRG